MVIYKTDYNQGFIVYLHRKFKEEKAKKKEGVNKFTFFAASTKNISFVFLSSCGKIYISLYC